MRYQKWKIFIRTSPCITVLVFIKLVSSEEWIWKQARALNMLFKMQTEHVKLSKSNFLFFHPVLEQTSHSGPSLSASFPLIHIWSVSAVYRKKRLIFCWICLNPDLFLQRPRRAWSGFASICLAISHVLMALQNNGAVLCCSFMFSWFEHIYGNIWIIAGEQGISTLTLFYGMWNVFSCSKPFTPDFPQGFMSDQCLITHLTRCGCLLSRPHTRRPDLDTEAARGGQLELCLLL